MARPEYKLEDFCYVEVRHENAKTGFRTKWLRKKLGDPVEKFRNKYKNYNVFMTVQRYLVDTRLEGEEEINFTPLFFDMDSKLPLMRTVDARGNATKGLFELEKVTVYELRPFVSDEDYAHLKNFEMGIELPQEVCDRLNHLAETNEGLKRLVWLKNLERARSDVRKLLAFFKNKFALSESALRVYFSGSKGFHVFINPYAMGVKPRIDLHHINKFIVENLVALLQLESLDQGVYGSRRMIRMPNSIHQSSGLFKVELKHEELSDLEYVIDHLAKGPRGEHQDDPVLEVNDDLNLWYRQMIQEWEESYKLSDNEPKTDILQALEDDPVCVKHIMEVGILKSGDRNPATVALASYFKDRGYPMEQTIDLLLDWVKKIPSSMVSHTPSEVRASTISAVKAVYDNDKYHFGCPFILALHGEKKGKTYEKVQCAGRKCPMHPDHDEDREPPVHMHLAKTADANFTGKKVSFDALVSGKLDTPYIVPKQIQYICKHVPFCDKKECIMHKYNGVMDKEILDKDRILIEATNQNDSQQIGMLRRLSGALCNKVYPVVEEYTNVTELNVVPMADRVMIEMESKEVKSQDSAGYEYVNRRIYALDFEVKPNQHYRIEGYVYNHPKNSTATLLAQKVVPKEDNIDDFKLTEEMKDQFKVFQVPEVDTDNMETKKEVIDNHLNMLIKDLEDNVTFVYQRRAVHLALLLTYHSCLRYYFREGTPDRPALPEPRGWMEITMIGDTGQAKSQLVDNFMNYVGLGNSASAEALKRTGFTYNMQKMGDKWFLTWGMYPLSDRRLLKIDEFSAMDADTFGTLTEARTSGVLKVHGMVNTETNARVRLVLLTNPAKPRRSLAEFTYPVESIKYLLPESSDIRRLDLAIFLAEGDVSPDVLHRPHKPSEVQLLPSELLRNSILWMWSRTEHDIVITPEAKQAIFAEAKMLSKKYGASRDIPLLAPSDLDKKLARVSIALAGLLHSTDETHEKVIVKPEHVHYIAEWIDLLYSLPNCQFDAYNVVAQKESELSDEEAQEIWEALHKLNDEKGTDYVGQILDLFSTHDSFTVNDIVDLTGFSRDDVLAVTGVLTRHHMLKKVRRSGMIKLPKLQKYLTKMSSPSETLVGL
jgi:hypothetical protein